MPVLLAGTATAAAADTLYLSYVSSPSDVDLFRVPPARPGTGGCRSGSAISRGTATWCCTARRPMLAGRVPRVRPAHAGDRPGGGTGGGSGYGAAGSGGSELPPETLSDVP